MSDNPMMTDNLAAPFHKQEIHWRAQTLTRDGKKALALAYIDARDVMRRLDEVVGPDRWQDSYVETPSGRVICTLSIWIGNAWVSKSDGAGDTAIEGEKGGLSDAFKRAGVKWGIGRYLYALGNVWAPCETWQGQDGKMRWSKWTADPWKSVRAASMPKETEGKPAVGIPLPPAEAIEQAIDKMKGIWNTEELVAYWSGLREHQPGIQSAPGVAEAKDAQKAAIEAKANERPSESVDDDSVPF